jgi:hypothetical protein
MRRFILFSITAICLIGILYTFKLVTLSPPQQVRSKLTGSPVWRGEIESVLLFNLFSHYLFNF